MPDLNQLRGAIYTKYRNLTDFGSHVGWNRQKVCRIINGKTKPSFTDLKLICDALEISLDEGIAFFNP